MRKYLRLYFFFTLFFSVSSTYAIRSVTFTSISNMIGVGCACKVNIRNISNYTQTVTVTGGIKYLTNTADHFSFVPSGPQVLGVDQALSFQLSGYDCNKTNAAQWDMECQGKVSVQEDRGAIQGAGFQLLNDYSSAVPAFSIGRYVTFLINGGRPF